MSPASERIADVRADVLARLILLLRERFDPFRKASLFLARQQGAAAAVKLDSEQIEIVARILAVLLRPERTDMGQWRQLSRAETELRWATMEPYATAVMLEARKLQHLREQYAGEVLPLVADARLSAAPALDRLDAVLQDARSVRPHRDGARNDDWDAAVIELIALFEHARTLHQSMSAHLATARQIRQERINRWFAWVGIVLALLGMGLSLALGA